MARKKKKAARARNAKGHFVKKTVKRKKAKRAHAAAPAVKRKKSGRKKAKRPAHTKAFRRHKVRAHKRKKKSGGKVTVKRHYSRETPRRTKRRRAAAREVIMVRESPRRRRKKARRRSSAREVLFEAQAPKPKRRRKKAKRSRKGTPVTIRRKVGKKRRATKVFVSGKKRRGAKKVRVKRRRKGHTRIVPVYVSAPRPRKRRKAAKRRSPKRRSHKRRGHRRSAREMILRNPLGMSGYSGGEHPLSNPLSGGEFALAGATMVLGYMAADVLNRFMATSSTADAQTNATMVLGVPSLGRIGAQGAMALVFAGSAHLAKTMPMARAALQGAALGSAAHLIGQLVKTYVIAKLFPTNATVAQLYPDTMNAEAAQTALVAAQTAAPTATHTVTNMFGAGVSGPPKNKQMGVGAPGGKMRPSISPFREVGPYATKGVGDLTVTPVPGGAVVTTSTEQCAPCSSTSMQDAVQQAYNAARDDTPDCGPATNHGFGGPPLFTVKPGAMEIAD